MIVEAGREGVGLPNVIAEVQGLTGTGYDDSVGGLKRCGVVEFFFLFLLYFLLLAIVGKGRKTFGCKGGRTGRLRSITFSFGVFGDLGVGGSVTNVMLRMSE